MNQSRINPAQLGAIPSRDLSNCWTLVAADQLQMTIAAAGPGEGLFVATVRIATLLPDAQAYQLAAALMLNRDVSNLKGGAVAYNVHDDNFLYCLPIDARLLSLSSFQRQAEEGFATARLLRDLMLHAQEDIGPPASTRRSVSTSDLMAMRSMP